MCNKYLINNSAKTPYYLYEVNTCFWVNIQNVLGKNPFPLFVDIRIAKKIFYKIMNFFYRFLLYYIKLNIILKGFV